MRRKGEQKAEKRETFVGVAVVGDGEEELNSLEAFENESIRELMK